MPPFTAAAGNDALFHNLIELGLGRGTLSTSGAARVAAAWVRRMPQARAGPAQPAERGATMTAVAAW